MNINKFPRKPNKSIKTIINKEFFYQGSCNLRNWKTLNTNKTRCRICTVAVLFVHHGCHWQRRVGKLTQGVKNRKWSLAQQLLAWSWELTVKKIRCNWSIYLSCGPHLIIISSVGKWCWYSCQEKPLSHPPTSLSPIKALDTIGNYSK